MTTPHDTDEMRSLADWLEKQADAQVFEMIFCLLIAGFAAWATIAMVLYEGHTIGTLIFLTVAAIAFSGAARAARDARRLIRECNRLRWQLLAE